MKRLPLLIAILFAVGCQKEQTNTPEPTPEKPAATQSVATPPTAAMPDITPPGPARPAPKPTDVLVDVNGTKLLRKDAEAEAQVRFGDRLTQIPPAQRGFYMQRMIGEVVGQFVGRTLILQECDKKGVKITDKEKEKALDEIRQRLPDGKTLDEVIAKSPMGKEKVYKEIVSGLRINKLLEQVLTNNAAITDQEIEAFVAEYKDRLQRPERVHARHILLTVKEDADAETKAAKKKEAEKIRAQLIQGSNFVEMAKQFSEGPSNVRGGDLGYFGKGQMVPPFDKVAFALSTNEISEVVETQFGYHIIKVLDHAAAGIPPREELEKILKNKQQQESLEAYIDSLKTKANVTFPQEPKTPQMPGMPPMQK